MPVWELLLINNKLQLLSEMNHLPFVLFVCFHSLTGAECIVSLISIQNGRLPHQRVPTSITFLTENLQQMFSILRRGQVCFINMF